MSERHDIESGARRDAFLRDLGDRLGAAAGVEKVYGSPVERGDVTVIPVARVKLGFGGGAGRQRKGEEGLGGGGGAQVVPIGYIELGAGGASFVEIRDRAGDRARLAAVAGASGLGLWLALRGLAAVLRATRGAH